MKMDLVRIIGSDEDTKHVAPRNLPGIMSAYLVVLMQSPTHPAPAVSSVPISFAGRALMDWTFVFSQEGSSKIGVAMVESESWREEWQTLASLLYLYELEITALASVEGLQSAASKELWKFRGITRLGGPVENFLKPVPGNRTLALLLRTPGNEELSYRVLQLKPEESTPPPALGFSVASYVVSGSCNAADLSPEKPTCVPSLPAPVTFNELPFPGSLVVMRAAQGPKGVFYSRERESEIFRYFPFDGKDAEMLPSPPTSNPLSRLRPLLMVPMPTDNGDLALLDVRYSLSDSHLTFEAVVYVASTSSPSGRLFNPLRLISWRNLQTDRNRAYPPPSRLPTKRRRPSMDDRQGHHRGSPPDRSPRRGADPRTALTSFKPRGRSGPRGPFQPSLSLQTTICANRVDGGVCVSQPFLYDSRDAQWNHGTEIQGDATAVTDDGLFLATGVSRGT